MHTERMFLPTKGRLERKVGRRKEAGLCFCGSVWSVMWGPLCQFLVFRPE
jgi:hypothetical protein